MTESEDSAGVTSSVSGSRVSGPETRPAATVGFNAGLSSFYMSIPKTGMPSAATGASTASSAPSAVDDPSSAAAFTASKRNALDEGIRRRIKAVAAKKKNEDGESSNGSKFNVDRMVEYPTARYSDFGALDGVVKELREAVERPFRHPEVYAHLGVEVPRGVLLHGPPGCGKSALGRAIAGELGVPLLRVAGPEIVSGMSGESEAQLRELFEAAERLAPAIIFIDEIDAITPKRETAQREMERRIVAQLIACMDELGNGDGGTGARVLVIGATNRQDSLDPALRRAGRFDREIKLTIPGESGREQILRTVSARLRLADNVDFMELARRTPGYAGADLRALMREAASCAVARIFAGHELHTDMDIDIDIENGSDVSGSTPSRNSFKTSPIDAALLKDMAIEQSDCVTALAKIQPSATREGFAVVPDTTWEDIGALSYVREELRLAVVEPLRQPELFAAVGLTAPAGVLLYGPPGCGKTLLAKAVAHETHSNFISVKGPELLDKYVGESERAVRRVFERARASAPCVIFFDEFDALCPRRSMASGEGDASARIVNQLLTEMDGLEGRQQVFLLAATNRPDLLDPALTRPGRLDKALCVRLPTPDERADILRTVSRKTPWHSSIDLNAIAHDPRADGFSGADLAALVREAALCSIRSLVCAPNPTESSHPLVHPEHIEAAFARVKRSVSPSDEALYNSIRSRT